MKIPRGDIDGVGEMVSVTSGLLYFLTQNIIRCHKQFPFVYFPTLPRISLISDSHRGNAQCLLLMGERPLIHTVLVLVRFS